MQTNPGRALRRCIEPCWLVVFELIFMAEPVVIVSGNSENSGNSGHSENSVSSGGRGRKRGSRSGVGKYARYTEAQLVELEKVYSECQTPSCARRKQLMRECPVLSNIQPRQIKVWFQNRRCRDRQKNESVHFQTVNKRLAAMNRLLMEENDRLQSQVSELVYENDAATNHTGCASVGTYHQHSLGSVDDPTRLLLVAMETKVKFLGKATGTAVDWVQIPGMKPGPDSFGIFAISGHVNGVGARACGVVALEPVKIAEILKDRSSWFHDCRKEEIFAKFPAKNGGTIELIYLQIYAPTTLAPARDFWTLRSTSNLEDGGLLVCESSVSGSGAGSDPPTALEFVRARMLPSGYLVRPCEGGSSIIHIVDHLDLEAVSVPEVLQPLYQSPRPVAQRMTIAALEHLWEIAQETRSEMQRTSAKQPSMFRAFRQQLSRGFNDAINGFNDDGWSLMNSDTAGDLLISIKPTTTFSTTGNWTTTYSVPGGVLCVKGTVLLHDIHPGLVIRFLREHRCEWADCSDAYSAAATKTGSFALLGLSPTHSSGNQTIIPLEYNGQNEIVDIIQLEGNDISQDECVQFRNMRLLQMCNGVEENSVGACSELIFSPINEMFPDEMPLLSSGFRILPLDSRTRDLRKTLAVQQRLDLAFSLEAHANPKHATGFSSASEDTCSLLTVAFQFPFEGHLHEDFAMMAQHYIRNVISSVQRISIAMTPSLSSKMAPNLTPCSPTDLVLAHWICHSYRFHLGADLVSCNHQGGLSLLKQIWHHQYAIFCCSFKLLPGFIYANQTGLQMLEATPVALHGITLNMIFDEYRWSAVSSVFPKIMEEGFALLPAGICHSTMAHDVSYEQASAWRVPCKDDYASHCLAFAFVNWSFM